MNVILAIKQQAPLWAFIISHRVDYKPGFLRMQPGVVLGLVCLTELSSLAEKCERQNLLSYC